MSKQRPLHRLFELSWDDFFRGSDITVEPEKDLSLKQQFVDLVLIRQGPGMISRRLPDGFEDLGKHNLLTFKSHQEPLDDWALCELVAHFVNHRKQASTPLEELLPQTDFRLFAVCVRFPHNLEQQVTMTSIRAGVYEVALLTLRIRIIVINQLPPEQHNAMLQVFSANTELRRYGKEHYRPYSKETSTLLYALFKEYKEDPDMSERLDEFVRETIDDLLSRLSVEERLKGLPAEERLKGLPAEERLKGLPAEERLKGLSPEQRLEGLSPEELRAALDAAQRRLQTNGPSGKPQ